MSKGWTDRDPDKGKPYRRVHERIAILVEDVRSDPEAMYDLVMKVAEIRPEDVLTALGELHEEIERRTDLLEAEGAKDRGSKQPEVPLH